MRFVSEEQDGAVLARLAGRLDTAGVGAIEVPFTAQLSAASKPVLIDLTQVEFVASLGLRLLITLARTRARAAKQTLLFGAKPEVSDILSTSGVDEIIPVVANEGEALGAV